MTEAGGVVLITVADPQLAVTEFFEHLGRYCAAVDYDAAEALFAEDVVSFGTKASVITQRRHLRRQQWEEIWGNIADFRLDLEQIRAGGDERVAWGMAPWTSTGFDETGASFDRPGRATVILERFDDAWLAVHTHFSLVPGTPARTHGASETGNE